MIDSQAVDLLLVRLSRDEEKEKVIEMLITELGMSRDEAGEKVDNSPNILIEGISMEQARILQNRMYPYVDLLPRSYSTVTKETNIPADVNQEEITSGSLQTDETDIDKQNGYSEEKETDNSEDIDEGLVITTAAEEMISVERCHICGRTPTSVQKLVPCRTCGELTCSECFDRKMHVCEKCVSEGRVVDRPLDNKPGYSRKQDHDHKKVIRKDEIRKSGNKKG